MKKYKTKSKVFGYNIGLNNDNLYIAVPKKYVDKEPVEVTCGKDTKIFTSLDKVGESTLPDKYGKGMTYTLYYFLWKVFDAE